MSRQLMALVIGNADYENATKLKNPVNDANDITTKLVASGFTVDKVLDCTYSEMDRALKRFKGALKDKDVGLFFFAGHGLQIDGENYLTAIDTDASGEVEAKHSSLPLNRVIDVMEKADTQTSIIILDACRDNPFERAWTRSTTPRGLAPVYAPRGSLIAYATSPGQVASDGSGRNGAYTAALLQHISTPDCSIENMFKRVRNTLSAATAGKQISWEHTSLAGEFFFNLSLGVRIDVYSEEALSDKLFVLDDAKVSHRVIRALKSLTWPTQNSAISEFTADKANKASTNSLFVLGRNVYQAACGGSNGARGYIDGFVDRTRGMDETKRKAILDGMLFEVFFDPLGRLRTEFKFGSFQSVFALQTVKELAPSFDFIAECLLPDIGRFHVLPGKKHAAVVDVKTKPGPSPGQHIVEAIYFGGSNILWLEDLDYAPEPGETPPREKLSVTSFEEKLAEQMVVPAHLLDVKYASELNEGFTGQKILFPYGWTTRKR
jgi:hypothetical protein